MRRGKSLPSTDQADRVGKYLVVAVLAYLAGVLATIAAGQLAFYGGIGVAVVAMLVLAGIGARAEAIETAEAGGSQ